MAGGGGSTDGFDPRRIFGSPNEIGSAWFEEIRRRTASPSIEWFEAVELSAQLLIELTHRLGGVEDDPPVSGGVHPEVEEIHALRAVFRTRTLRGLPPVDAVEVLEAVDHVLDRLVGRVVRSQLHVLESAAFLDPLTGVGNRRALERDLGRELARSFRHGRPVCVATIDVDGLKAINDTNGHAAGDAALRRLASALTETLRIDDAVYRVGGDEFVVLLPETQKGDVHLLLERAAATAPSFSFGLAEAPMDAATADAILAFADADLFASRRWSRRGTGAAELAAEEAIDLVAEEAAPGSYGAYGTGRLVIDEVLTAAEGTIFSAQIRLRRGDEVLTGRASGPGAAAAACRIVATAALDAVAASDARWTDTFLESAGIVRVGEADVALVHVVLAEGSYATSAVGSAQVRQERREVAVAAAVLDALNRRLAVAAAASIAVSPGSPPRPAPQWSSQKT